MYLTRCSGILWFFLMLTIYSLPGQDSIRLDEDFEFEDGWYRTYTDFKANRPNIPWDNVRLENFTNPKNGSVRILSMADSNGDPLEPTQFWGCAYSGKVFVRVPADSLHNELPVLAPIQLLGNICYFSYETIDTVRSDIRAYNPLTGKPFRSASVERSEWVIKDRIFQFRDGEVFPMRKEIMLKWLEGDAQLRNALAALAAEDLYDGLIRAVEVYNRRNPVFILQ